MLTGYATPYLFNGTQEPEYSDFDECYGDEKVGILDRNYIGFLIWDKSEGKTSKHGLGSRYKTPHMPIWVTSVNNQWGVLFNPRLDLMKSHRETFKTTLRKDNIFYKIQAKECPVWIYRLFMKTAIFIVPVFSVCLLNVSLTVLRTG